MAKSIELKGEVVQIDGVQHPIKFDTEPFVPNEEYDILGYKFTYENGQTSTESDGCLFRIKEHGSTRVMEITDPRLHCDRMAVKGQGWFLGLDPVKNILCYEIGTHLGENNPLVSVDVGSTDCFIAASGGLEVVDISTPPFEPAMEVLQTPEKNNHIPPEFWHYYNTLRHGDETEISKLNIIKR
jgi:hypothetical protein